jgi:hypothetical protein
VPVLMDGSAGIAEGASQRRAPRRALRACGVVELPADAQPVQWL